ncbi:DUF4444 domain-containing protein [Roseibium denhamense]|uniref:Biotin-(Acetyl-CoA carboxylase) ligase n=1 Tax=Roseibium denhamense TaxID=76305 RepID=A0ABY1NH08_9HYPH|nr:biotin/lipoate--protein ligase family protein [Roseibium denhamense]MTI06473.1 DUF4444 domain-containing protein [Roseibium denhamense]SMP09445.1 Biotin-(acetyl-CoA carboxylase) ligase [Roseibium denhamense]
MTDLQFPPLFQGEAVTGQADPIERAVALATVGTDSGTVVYNLTGPDLKASMVFAPEMPLEQAMTALPVCGLGFQAALGALAPPEVAVHLGWDGKIRVNGAVCGRFRVKASTADPAAEPDWLIVGLELSVTASKSDPGYDPNRTSLTEEGCAEVSADHLLEAWVRHTLYWINRWLDEGARPVHAEWRGLVQEIGEPVDIDDQTGTFTGVDEHFGMLLRTRDATIVIPLSSRLET